MNNRAPQSEDEPPHTSSPGGFRFPGPTTVGRAFWTLLIGVAAGGCDSEAAFRPTPPLTSLTMQPDSARIAVGDSVDFDVVFEERRGDSLDAGWTWSVEDSAIATVDRIGVAVGTSAGRTTIRADRVIDGDEMSVGASLTVVAEGGP